MKIYNLLQNGKVIQSQLPGTLAGWKAGKIFGKLDCKSGMRMNKENRVFFLDLEDAVKEGYRPCKNCRPINENNFKKIRHLVSYKTLLDFYNRDTI